MSDEIRRLRRVLAAMTRGRGRRYPLAVRQRIGSAAVAARRGGASWQAIGAALGIPHETVRRAAAAAGPAGDEGGGFLSVEIAERSTRTQLVLIAPGGYRLEGLDLGASAELLRRLA
jgi:hypothetical protein